VRRVTLVDAGTGEVVELATQEQAERIVANLDRLVVQANVVNGELIEEIAEALRLKAWVPLGYGSWEAMTEARGWEFSPRTSTDRAALAKVMRESGMSYRAIGKLVGASKNTVQRDMGIVPNGTMPETVNTTDGRSYPATRPTAAELVEELAPDDTYPGEAEAIADELDADATPEDIGEAIDEAIESREPAPITKPDLGGGVSHPARFSDNLLPIFAAALVGYDFVLDPFAGTGRIHELPNHTYGVELEPEWAALHPDTIVGSALDLPFDDCEFDAICTSPTYGNRLADHHQASDPERRRSYTHDLGRPLTPDNSGVMHWGDTYREFHEQAWAEAVRVLRHGGRFVLNIKDHIRDGVQQPVCAWHVATLTDLGLRFNAELSQGVPTRHLRQGTNTERAGQELVLVFDRGIE
jgi:SAM-dependent methyltransferase/transposase